MAEANRVHHDADFCVIGGGMAGTIAAIAAARHGTRTVLIQDRPMLGGNASSEIRMWICGAHGENNHETGILEEMLLENLYRQTAPSYSVWDSVVWEKAHFQENLTLILNCSVNSVEGGSPGREVAGGSGPGGTRQGQTSQSGQIRSVTGWQLTTETWHTVTATHFADCTGDGTVGMMAGAEYRRGRESRDEFSESIAPVEADERTMGLSCLIQARETDRPQRFIPPSWAYHYDSDGDLPDRGHNLSGNQNFWWLEIGGMDDSIHDTETLRDELQKIAYGVWDHIKNRGDHGAENWALDWIGFLPGKRESRRFVGDHILTQNDVEAEGRHFDDVVAYGGWTMDDHFPEGFYKKEAGTVFHPAPSPYGIPYRCLYSRNIDNLLFAGRNISATHTAMSSTRVMATCSVIGQAVGTAAALAVQHDTTPRGVYENHLSDLQGTLQTDDCYLPFEQRRITAVTETASLSASNDWDPEPLGNGWDRIVDDQENCWWASAGDSVTLSWPEPTEIDSLRLVFDSDLSRTTHNMVATYRLDQEPFAVPPALVKGFTVEASTTDSGSVTEGDWQVVYSETGNHQRLVGAALRKTVTAVRVTIDATWGADRVRVFALDCV